MALIVALIEVAVAPALAYPRPGRVDRVSVGPGGQGSEESNDAALSADGRLVAFYSHVTDLVPGDTNAKGDVFLRDRATGAVERVSVSTSGEEGDSSSGAPSMSADGRYVAFSTFASNFAPGGTDITSPDIFVRDRELGTTERVSVSSAGVKGNGASFSPSISADGRYVAFESLATNLVPGDAPNEWDIFVHDRETLATERVSVSSEGVAGTASSYYPSISGDGRFVAFSSMATNLVPLDVNRSEDIFVHDRTTRTTERVSVASDGTAANQSSFYPSISDDGRLVAFEGWGFNLTPGDLNRAPDIFVHDRSSRRTELVSLVSDGIQAAGQSVRPVISGDGRYVAFSSAAPNLAPGDDNTTWDVFVHDRTTGATDLVSSSMEGAAGNGASQVPAISRGGSHVAFHSLATDLVPDDTNGWRDVFVGQRGPAVGVGGLAAERNAGAAEVSGWATFSGAVVAGADDPPDDGVGPSGAEIVGASVTYRPEREDLLLRTRLASLPGPLVGGAPGVVYRWVLTAGGSAYEVRTLRASATGEPSGQASVALFECDPACTEVARLSGGVGTTGAEVWAALPLAALGVTEGAELTGLRASTGPGEAIAGTVTLFDEVVVGTAALPRSVVHLGIAPAGGSEVTQEIRAQLAAGRFSGTLDTSDLPAGPHEVRARACLGDDCGVASLTLP